MKVSFAQNGEDILLWRCFCGQKSGFYVDVGASSPIRDSVTNLFYEAGWRGMNFEPVPERVAELKRLRPRDITIAAAASDCSGEIALVRTNGVGGLSTILPLEQLDAAYKGASWVVTVARMTLSDALAQHGVDRIDFLKIDVEGAEADVLAGLDFKRWRPAIVLVEATKPMSSEQNHEIWEPILLKADYRAVWFDGLNRYYVSTERATGFAPCFDTPPNVFDGFTPFGLLGAPLNAPAHPDHRFALHFAQLLLRAVGVETTAYLDAAMRVDLSPQMLSGPVTAQSVGVIYTRVLARAPSVAEAQAHVSEGLSGGELIRRLLEGDEFLAKRARISI